MVERFLAVLLALSWVYWLAALWLVRAFFRHVDEASEPRGGLFEAAGLCTSGSPFQPPVSVLKPVRGLDTDAYANFQSFCEQDYPDYEILFGVVDPDDPAVPLIRRLQRTYPWRKIRLLVVEPAGANEKAVILHQLAAAARCDYLVMSDSDTRVTPDYLERVVAPLRDDEVGIVTCPYAGASAETFPAGFEALHMGVTFLPSVIVGRRVTPIRFGLGASIAVRRQVLDRLGGFVALADYLAEDYQLGARAAALGYKIHLSEYVIDIHIGATTFREEWQREVRWARCTRVSRPWEYPGLLLTFATPLSLVLGLVAGFDERSQNAILVSIILRWVFGWMVTGYTGDRVGRRWLFWLPARDGLSMLVWLAGLAGSRVVWRGRDYHLLPGGKMRPAGPGVAGTPAPVGAAAPDGSAGGARELPLHPALPDGDAGGDEDVDVLAARRGV